MDGQTEVKPKEAGMVLKMVTSAGKEELKAKVDHWIVELICVAGIPPSALDRPVWKDFVNTLNPSYQATSSSTFTTSLILKEAAHVRAPAKEFLQTHNNLLITFDGGTTCKPQSVYTFHTTTPQGTVVFLEGWEESNASHTGEWICNALEVVRLMSSVLPTPELINP